jgi:hypothetical protein
MVVGLKAHLVNPPITFFFIFYNYFFKTIKIRVSSYIHKHYWVFYAPILVVLIFNDQILSFYNAFELRFNLIEDVLLKYSSTKYNSY